MKRLLLLISLLMIYIPASHAVEFSRDASYYKNNVKPVLEKRCVVCHGCFSSPCNLKLDSYFGALRGASKDNIYGTRLFDKMKPNRMFQDAKTHQEWQKDHNYHSVVKTDGNEFDNFNDSIMGKMLSLHQEGKNSKKFNFNTSFSRSCVQDESEFVDYAIKNGRLGGMPYGMEKLNSSDYKQLKSWLGKGAKGYKYSDIEELEKPSAKALESIVLWDSLLNQSSKKVKLVSRYIFEHFYAANITFDGSREFYRLVRSKTAHPNPIDEIVTRRPYDNPKSSVIYYRFKKVIETIVHKNHIPLVFNTDKYNFIKKLFLSNDWSYKKELPSYSLEDTSNPFITFKSIPAKKRYKFFLEHSFFFIRSFIHGPVCNGQVATNVIRDHFWVSFVDPNADPTVNDKKFLNKVGRNLDMPAKTDEKGKYLSYMYKNRNYQKARANLYKKYFVDGFGMDHLWKGHKNSLLTVFRNHDNANVYRGVKGTTPKTVWVIDYPIFERIYYDLVAGFDVWGNSSHKISTRRYMDLLRTESEDNFLLLFEKSNRKKIRRKLNIGVGVLKRIFHRYFLSDINSSTKFKDESGKGMYLAANKILEKYSSKVLNRVEYREQSSQNFVTNLDGARGKFLKFLPEISMVRIKGKNGEYKSYSLMKNNYRPYVNYMFLEPRSSKKSYLTVLNGLDASYAYMFFDLKETELDVFVSELKKIKKEKAMINFVKKYGKTRTQKGFWELSDWFQNEAIRLHPVQGALIDLSKYEY